jgi:hypothetical protein
MEKRFITGELGLGDGLGWFRWFYQSTAVCESNNPQDKITI